MPSLVQEQETTALEVLTTSWKWGAGLANTTGSNNNMIGRAAGRCATVTGSHNNFFGTYAGKCASGLGACNNFIGYEAGCASTGGSYNNFIEEEREEKTLLDVIITSLETMQD